MIFPAWCVNTGRLMHLRNTVLEMVSSWIVGRWLLNDIWTVFQTLDKFNFIEVNTSRRVTVHYHNAQHDSRVVPSQCSANTSMTHPLLSHFMSFFLYIFSLICPLEVDRSAFCLSASLFVFFKHFNYLFLLIVSIKWMQMHYSCCSRYTELVKYKVYQKAL